MYSKMVDDPFNDGARSPFAYRVITPLFAHFLRKNNAYYRSKGPFEDAFIVRNGIKYESAVLQSLILANFIFLVGGMFFLSETIRCIMPHLNYDLVCGISTALPLTMYLSISTNAHTLSGLTEGGSLFFVCLLLYLFHGHKFKIFLLFSILSVLQRELVPIIVIIYVMVHGGAQRNLKYMIACVVAIGAYFAIRAYFPISGNEGSNKHGKNDC